MQYAVVIQRSSRSFIVFEICYVFLTILRCLQSVAFVFKTAILTLVLWNWLRFYIQQTLDAE